MWGAGVTMCKMRGAKCGGTARILPTCIASSSSDHARTVMRCSQEVTVAAIGCATDPLPLFGPCIVVAKWLDGSRCHLVQR